MIRVLVADDHPVVRQGLRQIVSPFPDLSVVAEATTGADVLAQMGRVACDIILLDLSMPGSYGLDVLKALRRDWPKTPVLVLTMHGEEQFAVRTLVAGASGYLTKDGAPAELVKAIRQIVRGGRYITPSVAERLVDHLGCKSERPTHELLSDREHQVLRLIAAGKTTREIAAELSLSHKTVGTYRSRMCEKLRIRSGAELMAYAIRSRLFD
jgi:two-component system invasion response regulator UvrY